MKKLNYYMLLFFSTWIFYFYGCEIVSTTQFTGHLKGAVHDSTSHEALDRVYFHTIPNTGDTVSDVYGNYVYDIPLSSSTQAISIIISRIGYLNDTLSVEMKADETYYMNFGLIPVKGIFIANGLILAQYVTNISFSAVNLIDLLVEQDRMFDVDIRFRNDSNLVYLTTGYDDISKYGYQTNFSPALGTSTKNEFDTLARYYGASDPINPDTDFPNSSTLKYPFRNAKNQVFAVYLKGRYIPGTLHTFGLVHIDSVWIESGLYKMMMDVKLNIVGQNYFISNTTLSKKDRIEKLTVKSATVNIRHKESDNINDGKH
jgi:hypothetical protein